jgi:hypothetical protein
LCGEVEKNKKQKRKITENPYLYNRIEINGNISAICRKVQQPRQSICLLGGVPTGNIFQQGLLGVHATY